MRNNEGDLINAIFKQWAFSEKIFVQINLIYLIYLSGNSISGNSFIILDGKVNFCEIYKLKQFSQFNIIWDLFKHQVLRIISPLGHNDL